MKDGDFLNAVISGRFGSLTEAALKVFQAKYGIVSSGTAYTTGYGATGAKTNAKLNALLASGMLGN
jgi:peptidoglycan hydrolase-like protein with peptidoglycan-binding domain